MSKALVRPPTIFSITTAGTTGCWKTQEEMEISGRP
jgi:hypothetical protein